MGRWVNLLPFAAACTAGKPSEWGVFRGYGFADWAGNCKKGFSGQKKKIL